MSYKQKTAIYTALIILFLFSFTKLSNNSEEKLVSKELVKTIELISSNYINEISIDTLKENAIIAMVKALDQYSDYTVSSTYKETIKKMNSEFYGIGIECVLLGERLVIKNIIYGSGAYHAKVEKNSIITDINGKSISHFNNIDEIKKALSGNLVKIKTKNLRKNTENEYTLSPSYTKIRTTEAKIINKKTGYIKINSFSEKTAEDVLNHLNEFLLKDIRGIILDLRDNPGGVISSSISVANMFLEIGSTVCFIQTRDEIKQVLSSSKGPVSNIPVILLVNKRTASAAELLAYALNEKSNVVSMGSKTFGKGRIQKIFRIGKSTIKITTSQILTPSKVELQNNGLVPDFKICNYFDNKKLILRAEKILYDKTKYIVRNSRK